MTRIVGGPAPSQADLDAAERVRELQTTELDRVRERAAKWRDGLVGLTALFSTIIVVGGRDSIAGLETWVKWAVGCALLVALASLIASGFNAMVAAFGWSSRPVPVGTAVGLYERILSDERRRVNDAIKRLKVAAALMLFSISAMTLAAGLSIFGPESGEGGKKPCIRLISAAGEVTTISMAEDGQTLDFPGPASFEIGLC